MTTTRKQPTFLYRLGRNSARHPFRVLGLWLVATLAVMALQSSVGGDFKDDFRIPGVESQQAADILRDRFPTESGSSARIAFHRADGRLDHAASRAAIDTTRAQLASGTDVVAVTDPFDPDAAALSPDGRTAYVDVSYDVRQLEPGHFDDAVSAIAASRDAGVQVELDSMLADVGEQDVGNEMLGILVAIVVLLVAFGSVVAMGLPIGTALFGIFVGLSAVGILAGVAGVPSVSTIIATMIGLGVGIDYALFIVTRHRENLHAGMTIADSAGRANATAGQAVIFAGTTVVIAILGLHLAGMPAITVMGIAIALVVAVAVVAAVTLLPALLGLAGTKIDKLSIHRKGRVAKPADATIAGRWARHVGGHPKRYAAASLAVLVVVAIPALSMRIGEPDDGNAAADTTQRKAYDLLADGFGEGFNGRVVVVVDVPRPADQVAVARVRDALLADPGVAAVTPVQLNEAGDTAVMVMNPTTSPQDLATDRLVRRLRADVLPAAVRGTEARALLTGRAMITDVTDRITDRLPWFIAAIVALSFLLLMVVFRSVLVPLKAALMNVLSIGAAYGVIVAVFQWGWGNGLIGVEHTVPIDLFVPMVMFAVLFGLSMDYEVFLLSRVREEYVRTGVSHEAVVNGLSRTARVITSAALIMISVFAAFILGDDVLVKMFGVGLSVAVLLDATIVRMVLVPSTMSLLGSANWWLPRWLDRILPHLDLEGEVAEPDQVGAEREGDLVAA